MMAERSSCVMAASFECSNGPTSVRMLLQAKANVNAADSQGQTALHVARGCSGCVAALLVARADPCARDQRGRTPLHTLAFFPEAAALLTALGADVDEAGRTALHAAARAEADVDPRALQRKGDQAWAEFHEALARKGSDLELRRRYRFGRLADDLGFMSAHHSETSGGLGWMWECMCTDHQVWRHCSSAKHSRRFAAPLHTCATSVCALLAAGARASAVDG